MRTVGRMPEIPTPALGGEGSGLSNRIQRAAREGDEGGVMQAARAFEAWFVKSMLGEMRKATSSEGGLFGSQDMKTFQELFDQAIADKVAEGRGLGLAPQIARAMQRYGGAANTSPSVTPASAPLASRAGFAWPLPAHEPGSITSAFGLRRDPIHGGHGDHKGLDVAAPAGTPVLSMADGVVLRAGASGGYGQVVEVDHGAGVIARYAHQSRIDVRPGEVVKRGQSLGAVGSTGRATGDHLHVEVHVDGRAVDPHAFLRGEGSSVASLLGGADANR